jgi:hypothetical protein
VKLIQGFFVQRHENLAIGYVAVEGAVPVVRTEIFPYMYAGVVWQEGGELVGASSDAQGEARLFDIHIEPGKISFKKQYLRHQWQGAHTHITYVFDKQEGNTWVGTWQHMSDPEQMWGTSRCVVTDVDDSLFQGDVARAVELGIGPPAGREGDSLLQ